MVHGILRREDDVSEVSNLDFVLSKVGGAYTFDVYKGTEIDTTLCLSATAEYGLFSLAG